MQLVFRALSLAAERAGKSIAANMPMIAITTEVTVLLKVLLCYKNIKICLKKFFLLKNIYFPLTMKCFCCKLR